mgnify:CR=1 FL=1
MVMESTDHHCQCPTNMENVPNPHIHRTHKERHDHTREPKLKEAAKGDGVSLGRADACGHQVGAGADERSVASVAGSEGDDPGERGDIQMECRVVGEDLGHGDHRGDEGDVVQHRGHESRDPQEQHVCQQRLVLGRGLADERSDAVADGTIIALDRRYALEMVQAGEVTVEYDKLIDRQLERAAITSISGFGKIMPEAAKVLVI